jgi:hypothetical protein
VTRHEASFEASHEDALLWVSDWHTQPLLATALHAGHDLRDEIKARMALDDAQRLHEEDPYTDQWTVIAENRIVPRRSRFEVDLNRSRIEAVYRRPADAWGLQIWKKPLPDAVIARSLAEYDFVYQQIDQRLQRLQHHFGHFVVFDIHAYNHRRNGPDRPAADPRDNPDINVGTGTMVSNKWRPLVRRFMSELRQFDFYGRHLDVRENVKFVGRQLPHWVHSRYPDSGCALAIEVKKFFMDEWTGQVFPDQLSRVLAAFSSTVPGVLGELQKL